MKAILSLLLVCLTAVSFGQDDKYAKYMTRNLEMLDTAETKATYIKLTNQFDRIAKAEKSKWLPHYYVAFTSILGSFTEEDKKKKRKMMEVAEDNILIADSLSPKNSEIYALRSFWYTGMMQVEGFASAMKYAPLSGQALDSAKVYDPKNPRVDYLQGTGLFYTPPAFGGGKDKAKPVLESAVKKYDSFEPETPIHPTWGREQAESMLKKCEEAEEEE